MKLMQWICGLAAISMLAACSDRDDLHGADGAGKGNNGSGFISIKVGLPGVDVTRANDDFDDGFKDEYDVKKLGILFFTGREEDATFYRAYDCSNDFENLDPTGDQVSSINKVTFPVNLVETTSTLWALAVVNYTKVMTIDKNGVVTLEDGNNTVFGEGKTIKDFMNLTTSMNLHNVTGEGFFMTNTPYTTSPGSAIDNVPTGFVHLLAVVNKDKIMESKADAEANPAAEIFVERAVAKVEVKVKDGDLTTNTLKDVDEIKWVIDNTEPSSYVARHLIPGNNNNDATVAPQWLAYTHTSGFPGTFPTSYVPYRFVGYRPFNFDYSTTNLDMYRIYFGADPQGTGIDYVEGIPSTMKIHKDDDVDFTTCFQDTGEGKGKAQYCFENTFDVKHMDYCNSTRALVRVKFKGGEFYTRGLDRNTYYSFTDAATSIAHYVVENSDVVSLWGEKFSTPQTITITDLECISNDGYKIARNNWINVVYSVVNGRLVVSDIKLYDGKGQADTNVVPFKNENQKNNVINTVNGQVTFNAYLNGYAYYAVRIKHFGDDLTPWYSPKTDGDNPKPIVTETTADAYGGTDENASRNYLGRYGVLRNNWYQITITSIDKFGEPTVGDLKLDATPDDKNDPEKAISCKINIMSWAKRTQSVKF